MLRSMCNNFRKWKSSYRVFIVFLSVLVFTFSREDYLRQYAQDVGLAVTPYFFAFQMDDGITRMLFYFGVVLLFCNAPFMDDQQMFVLVRTGRLRWFAGQLAYIVAANLVYFLWTALTQFWYSFRRSDFLRTGAVLSGCVQKITDWPEW